MTARTLTLRDLNRTLLLRQMLLDRRRVSVGRAVGRLVALQAQYAPSPYVALWSRLDGFAKEQLTRALTAGTVVKATLLRGTLHVVTRELYPLIQAAHIESQRGRVDGLGTDPRRLAELWPDEPVDSPASVAGDLLGTHDPWTVAFSVRAMPFVRTAPLGPWPHTRPSPSVLWREPLAPPEQGAREVVGRYLAAYGPAARADVEQFTGFRLGQIDPALDGLRTFRDEDGRVLFDLPRAKLADPGTRAPVRFLPAFDSIILAHRDRSRIVPTEYLDAVFNRRNATTKSTFTVDGLVAGSWRVEKRGVVVDPFAPLPRRVRREVDAEAALLGAFYAS